jgi:FAD dependent oxidoreductase
MFWPLSFLWPALNQQHLFSLHPASLTIPLSASQDTTVIVGGGIIGLSTAYYMVRDQTALSGQVPNIIVLDSASELFAGASGGSTGILGDYAFKPEVAELGTLSWELLKSLNQEFDGRSNWNWSEIVVRSVNFGEDAPPGYGKVLDRPIPRWFGNESGYHYHWISGPDLTARM